MYTRLSLFAGLTLALTASVQAGESWVGEIVLTRKKLPEIKLTDQSKEGKQVNLLLNRANYRVLEDKDGKLRIHAAGQEGWVDKADMVQVRDGPAFFTTLVQKDPDNFWNWLMRAIARRETGEFEGAIKDFNECIRLKSGFDKAFIHRGLAWIAMKEYDKAVADYTQAIGLDAKPATAHNSRGEAFRFKREYDKAIADYNEALRIDPKRVGPYDHRGKVWHLKKEYAKALADYDEALRMDPHYDSALAKKAYLLATCPDDKIRDGKKAVELARAACELTNWKNGWFVGVLGAAHAELGQFDEAIRWEQKGLEDPHYAVHSDGPDEPALARERLKAYAQKKPWRE